MQLTYHVRKGGTGSGNFGHAGRPGLIGGSATIQQPEYYIKSNYDSLMQAHEDPQYWILPNGKLLDNIEHAVRTPGMLSLNAGHNMSIVSQENEQWYQDALDVATETNLPYPSAFGLTGKEPDYRERVRSSLAGNNNSHTSIGLIGGAIRVSQYRKRVYVQTNALDTRTLRQLQRYVDEGKLDLKPHGGTILWDTIEATGTPQTYEDFMMAHYVNNGELKEHSRIRLKGGLGSGNFQHAGRPGFVGGSIVIGGAPSNYGTYADEFNAAPIDKASSAAKWRKNHQQLYNDSREFRALADTITMYTQGSYDTVRDFSEYAITGKVPEDMLDSSIPDWVNDNFANRAFADPMADYKNYFGDKDLHHNDETSAVESAAILQRSIADSKPIEATLYRGGQSFVKTIDTMDEHGNHEYTYIQPKVPEVGDNIDILGVSSFTTDETVATQFAKGDVPGNRRGAWGATFITVYEVESGAHGINVSPLSPWNQKEIVTDGRFEVTSVEPFDTQTWVGKRSRRKVVGYKVKMRQTGVWEAEPSKYAGKPVKTSYSTD